MRVRAIQTTYRGILFQSTLEADWAKTLDSLNIVWSYEPEGVRLPDGQNYRCDFYLPRLRTHFEVKGDHDERIDKPARLSDASMHAPRCESGDPSETLGAPGGECACGYGARFPYQLVVIGRANKNGRSVFELPHESELFESGASPRILRCPVCQQHSFAVVPGLPICRRCRQDASGGEAYRSGSVPFRRVEPPRGRRRARPA